MDMKHIMELLAEGKEKTKQLDNGYAYRNINEYLERLNSVLGTEHYNTEYKQVESLLIGNQLVISCVCRITILDANYQPVFYKEGCGATEVSRYKKDKDGFVNLKGAYHVAETDAFKNACKALGVFGFENEKDNKSGNRKVNSESSPKQATQTSQGASTGGTVRKYLDIICATTEAFKIEREDRNSGQSVYKVAVVLYENNKVNQQNKAEIIFYPNRYAKDCEKLNECIKRGENKSINLKLHVQVSGERDGIPQYVYDSFL